MKKNTNKTKISVIVITRSRPRKLINCLLALKKNIFKNFEVIVVDQDRSNKKKPELNKILREFKYFYYVRSPQTGKSIGLNRALNFVNSPLIAFTDDDCIPDEKWLLNIYKNSILYPKASAFFGKTVPYEPTKKDRLYCPAIFENEQKLYIDRATKHNNIGNGNNMAYRRSIFESNGAFKEWLGPGSIGSNGEDAEMSFRTLVFGGSILYDPDSIVYHDRWITLHDMYMQELSYISGEIACYFYYAIKGNLVAQKIIFQDFTLFFSEFIKIVKVLINMKRYGFNLLFWWIARFIARMRGVLVSVIYIKQ